MPSAASVKIDKQINPENALADSSQNLTPVRQTITIIEHKIRNLEKRKSKLESYRDLQSAGKELNADQKTAVAKYNEVLNTLDFARDLCKQFLGIAVASEKEAKKLAKKEAAAKYQAELARLREILLVQDALNQMGNDNVREDFLHGRNGAAQLTETDLKLLDDLYPAVTPKHEAGNPTAFMNEVQAAAEHLLAAVDGKPKEVFDGTYSQIKEVLGKIHESGYFDQAQVFESYVEAESVAVEPEIAEPVEPLINNHEVVAPQAPHSDEIPPVAAHTLPLIENLTIESRSGIIQQQQPPAPVEPQPPIETNLPQPPPPEPLYFQPIPQQPPLVQPPRPITEMLGSGNFFFLQESEIDPPPEQIPSQTFTNQTFGGHPVPPLVPPQHFTPIPITSNHQVPPQIPPHGNNGIDDNVMQPEEQQIQQQQHQQQQHNKESSIVNNNRVSAAPRAANNPSFYQNNNYNNNSNRSRPQNQQNRNSGGPRVANNRHS